MLDIEDIKKLTEYQLEAYKKVFITKDDGKEIRSDIQKLQANVFVLKEDASETTVSLRTLNTKIDNIQTTLDAVLNDKDTRDKEVVVLNHRMKKAEDWIDEVSPKVQVKFEH